MPGGSVYILDTQHLRQKSGESLGAKSGGPKPGEQETKTKISGSLQRTGSQTPFSDVSLVDTPKAASLSAISRNSASGTPIKLSTLTALKPSPAKSCKVPKGSVSTGHRRSASDSQQHHEHHLDLPHSSSLQGPSKQPSAKSLIAEERLSSSSAHGSHNSLQELENPTRPSAHSFLPDEEDDLSSPKAPRSRVQRWAACFCKDALLSLTLLGVLVGVALGMSLRPAKLDPQAAELLGFPGEIMLRLLKMLVLPLVAGSMVAGVCALRNSDSSLARVARYTFFYYATTTLTAVVFGIVLVNLLMPGKGQPFAGSSTSHCGDHNSKRQQSPPPSQEEPVSALEALLRVARSMFPDNIAVAAVDMNILGIITFSLMLGVALASIGEAADNFIHGIDVFNKCISTMVMWVLWFSPIGIASLIAHAIVQACDLLQTLVALGMWVLTVLLGLALFGAVLLPILLWVTTRQDPLTFLRNFSKALVMAFGTSSSSAALPVAMECAEKAGCDASIIKFVLPLGTTINMNGTALYESTTVIFIAQAHGVSLGLAGTIVVACTATLAAVGAAAIPSAGLITMLMVLQAVNLQEFAGDLAVILAIDWLLDRCRTSVNMMSDCLAVVMVDALCKEHQEQRYSQVELGI